MLKIDSKSMDAWFKAKNCQCDKDGCYKDHRLCEICHKKMVRQDYFGENQENPKAWGTANIVPDMRSGTDYLWNSKAAHIACIKKEAK